MAQKQEDKPDSEGVFAPYNEEITHLKRQIKGYEGQLAKLKKNQVTPNPKQVNLSPVEAVPTPTEAPQVEKPHLVRSWEKFCPDCGGAPNPNYVPPNVHCSTCKVPLGTIKQEDIKKEGDKEIVEKIHGCWNCGSQKIDVKL